MNKKLRVAEDLIFKFEDDILTGKLKSGEKLPTERELRDKMQISRGTVREAYRVLDRMGFIEIIKGASGGAFVKDIDGDHVSQTLAVLIRHGRLSVKEMVQFREPVETRCAALAAEKATREEKETLISLLEQGRKLARQDGKEDETLLWDMRMHDQLSCMAHNRLFEWMIKTFSLGTGTYTEILTKHKESLEDWEDIVEAVLNGESTRAETAMQAHIVRIRRRLNDDLIWRPKLRRP